MSDINSTLPYVVAVAGCLDYPDFLFRVKKTQMTLHSELLFNALCDSGCADWLDYHFQKKIMSYFPLRRTQ